MTMLRYVPLSEFERIRRLPAGEQRTRLFAAACRLNILYMVARAGSGHLGTSFSSVDILSWLFLNVVRRSDNSRGPQDICFSSKGHDAPALYAVLAGLGQLDFELIHTLRRLGGLPGHPDIHTPCIETNTGSLGMGVSKAKGMVLANRLNGCSGRVFVLTGDGELQEGQFWESLQPAANLQLGEITVIVDANRIQSDTWVAEVSHLGELEAKVRAFGWETARCDGHDPAALQAAFQRLDEARDRPKLMIADTLKGKGVSFMEPSAMDPVERMYRFHSGAPASETYERALEELTDHARALASPAGCPPLALESCERPAAATPGPTAQRLVAAYGDELVRQAERNQKLVVLDADLVLDCGLVPFRKRFPSRFIECGIAEQDMVSAAGGMALKGLLPVVHSFTCFLSSRPNEQIYNNATERTKIIYVGSLAGLIPGGPGHSHQCVRDISSLAAVPGLVMLEPCHEAEVRMAVEYCMNEAEESCYLRLVTVPCEIPYELPAGYRLTPGRGTVLRAGEDIAVIGYGPVLLAQAFRAAQRLWDEQRVSVRLINLPWLNRIDAAWLEQAIAGCSRVVTLDNHYVQGGQGQLVLATLAQLERRDILATQVGVREIPRCGTNEEVLKVHGLDAESLYHELAGMAKAARA